MNAIIEVQNLSKKYKERKILDDISFQINKGEIVALLGENGAGKSTLINILNQLVTKDSGTIQVMGTDKIASIREQVSVMLQNNLSLNRITVKELLNLSRSYYKQPLPYQTLIDLADLKKEEGNFLDKLSGGQKRRLTFAAAMAGDPKIIFLDEPTAGMDSKNRSNFWEKIAAFKNSGKTFFVTSHYLEELENIASHVMILKDTHLVYDGDLQSLRQESGEVIISFTTKLSRNIFTSIELINELTNVGEHFQLHTNNPTLVLEKLTPFLSQLDSLTVHQSSLESLYLELVKE
ncbi:ABC transporter ATP-binding protein [Enterococcus devriesei]|uniref:ABC transporter ATP-binding protein n=1 Tax=Enterococcus devriesei TaxID=319970 RepID=UPI0036D20DA9